MRLVSCMARRVRGLHESLWGMPRCKWVRREGSEMRQMYRLYVVETVICLPLCSGYIASVQPLA